jgi:hypothetical protein
LFRSLLRGLKAFRVEKIAKNFALHDHLQNFAEFPHSLGRFGPFATPSANEVLGQGEVPEVLWNDPGYIA